MTAAAPVSNDLLDFLATLRSRGVTLRIEGERLRYSARPGVLTPEHIESLKSRKTEIITLLQAAPPPDTHATAPRLTARGLEGPLALSYSQQALVESYPTLQNPRAQHSMIVRQLTGPLDVDALRLSMRVLADRHAVLRLRYARGANQGPIAVIDGPSEIELQIVEVVGSEDRIAAAREAVTQFQAPRFDLEGGPLWRARLIRLSPSDHVLVIVVHHSISDAWSLRVLSRDLLIAYSALAKGESPRLPALSVQFPDYAWWLREWSKSREASAHREYWRERLRGLDQPFWLPSEVPDAGDEYRQHGLRLDSAVVASVRDLARRENTTPAVIALAAFAIVLARWAARADVLVAVLDLGRRHPQLLDVIGCFMQAWVLRVDVRAHRSFVDLVRDVRSASLEAQQHLDVPFYELKKDLAAAADEKPLLHITFNYLRAGSDDETSGAVPQRGGSQAAALRSRDFALSKAIEPLDEGRGEKLVLAMTETDDALLGVLRYSPRRFSRRTIDAFWTDMKTLLEVAATPEGASAPLPRSALGRAAH